MRTELALAVSGATPPVAVQPPRGMLCFHVTESPTHVVRATLAGHPMVPVVATQFAPRLYGLVFGGLYAPPPIGAVPIGPTIRDAGRVHYSTPVDVHALGLDVRTATSIVQHAPVSAVTQVLEVPPHHAAVTFWFVRGRGLSTSALTGHGAMTRVAHTAHRDHIGAAFAHDGAAERVTLHTTCEVPVTWYGISLVVSLAPAVLVLAREARR